MTSSERLYSVTLDWRNDPNEAQALVTHAVSLAAHRLPDEIPYLVLTAAATALPRSEILIRTLAENYLDTEYDPEVMREIVLQTYLFAGYPRCINAMSALNKVLAERNIALRTEPLEPAGGEDQNQGFTERGLATCRIVYGDRMERLLENSRLNSPDLADWMVREGYGRVLSRPVVEFRVRELCALGALLMLDAERQLRSHLHGALNAGALPEEVEAVLLLARSLIPQEEYRRSEAVWEKVRRPGTTSGTTSSAGWALPPRYY